GSYTEAGSRAQCRFPLLAPVSRQNRCLALDACVLCVLLLGGFRELVHTGRRPIENTVGGFKPRPLGWGITRQCRGRHADRRADALWSGDARLAKPETRRPKRDAW